LPVERQTRQSLADHPAYEEIAAPLRKAIASVDHHARDADGRHPHSHRLLHSLPMRAAVDGETGRVVHAESNHRPSVVPARLNEIEFVASLGSVLVGPHIAGLGMNGESL
jgi:hypothetical protein